jgi:hypothetical protein
MTTTTHLQGTAVARDVIDASLPIYDMVLTEHLVVEAPDSVVFRTAKGLDFLTVRAPFVTALMTARTLPSRLMGRSVDAPPALRLAEEPSALPGWLLLGEVPGREVAFGAVGTLWKAHIEWLDVSADTFADFAEAGWGKIACHLLVRPDGPGRTVLTYECRTGTTDRVSRAAMARYWWLIRPFVGYIMRAVLRTIRSDAEASAATLTSADRERS